MPYRWTNLTVDPILNSIRNRIQAFHGGEIVKSEKCCFLLEQWIKKINSGPIHVSGGIRILGLKCLQIWWIGVTAKDRFLSSASASLSAKRRPEICPPILSAIVQ